MPLIWFSADMPVRSSGAAKKDDDHEPVSAGVAITVGRLTKRYVLSGTRGTLALSGIDLTIGAGEMLAIRGASGSGKSTLLHLIGGMDSATAGSLTVGELELTDMSQKELAGYRRKVGFIFQAFHLLPTLSARDNVVAPLLPYHTSFDKFQRGRDLLESVGLGDRIDALPSQLSGGEQQRVAIARALVSSPPLLIADEPTGNLDSATGASIVNLLRALHDRHGSTLLVATHDATVAAVCDRVIELRDGQLVAN